MIHKGRFHPTQLQQLDKSMSKKYFIFILITFSSFASTGWSAEVKQKKRQTQRSAQAPSPAEDTSNSDGLPLFGLVGLVASDPSIEPAVASSGRLGLFIGFGAEFKLSDWGFFQPELNYVQKGMEQSDGTVTTKYTYTNLELPLFFKAKLFADDINPFILTGPVFGWNISSKKETTTSTSTSSQNLGAATASYEFSWAVGFGGEIPLGGTYGALLAQARYEWGLTDIDPGSFTWKNRVFQFLLGYQMNF